MCIRDSILSEQGEYWVLLKRDVVNKYWILYLITEVEIQQASHDALLHKEELVGGLMK